MEDQLTKIATGAAVGIISELFKRSLDTLKDTEEWIRGKYKERDPFGFEARKYADQMEERYNSMRIFGMSEPRPLRSIYVRVNILDKIRARMGTSIEELEKTLDRDRLRFGTVLKTDAGLNVIDKIEKVIVLGKPGAGKTTFLKYVVLMTMDGKLDKNRIPVFVGLKEWSDTKLSLLDYIVQQFDICGFPDAKPYIEHILKQGNCILLLDGFDEVTTDVDKSIKEIQDFSDKYSKNQFVLSCRIAAFNYVFEKFTEVEMADFNDEQIEAFITNWFGSDTKTAHECWEKMKSDKAIKEIASIPLLLTMLCLTYDENLDFPSNRANLYGDAINALLKKWDTSRRINRRLLVKGQEIYRNLLPNRKESMLAKIAAKTFQDNQYFLPKRTLESYIADYIQHLPEANDNSLEPDSEAVLKAIEAHHGLIVERAKGIYSFSHLTFQEYFTAQYIVENNDKGRFDFLLNNMSEDKWREVILLTAGMLPEADDFLKQIRKKISKFTNKKITTFLDKATHCIIETSNFSPHICKVLSVNIFFNSTSLIYCGDYSSNIYDLFDETVCLLSRIIDSDCSSQYTIVGASEITLKSALISARNRSTTLANARASIGALANARDRVITSVCTIAQKHAKIYNAELKANIIEDLISCYFFRFEEKDVNSLNKYIYITQLLTECLDTGCYISKDTRQKLLDSILTEPWEG